MCIRDSSVGVLHAKGSRAVAYTRAAIDVVGADHRPHEFLHEVVLLIRTTRTADPRDAVRTVVGLQLRELVGDEVVRFVPSRWHELAILLQERRADAVRVVVKAEGITALQAGMSLVRFGIVGRSDRHDLLVLHANIQVTTHAAVSTHGAHDAVGLGLLATEHISDGARRASLRTSTATHTITVVETLSGALRDPTTKAATGHGQHLSLIHI